MKKDGLIVYAKVIIGLIALSFIALSCKKEESVAGEPAIKLFTPNTYQRFSVYDTIFIEAEIEHTSPILRISVSVTDPDEKPILSGISLPVGSAKYSLKTFIVIDNRYIRESQNYLNIKIEDEDKVFNNWYDLYIYPLEKELDNLLVVTGSGNENQLSLINLQGNINKLLDWNSEFLGGYYDSKNYNYYTSGSLIDGLMAFNLTDRQIIWEVNTVPGNSLPHFTCFTASTGKVSCGIRGGYIESYNAEGMKIFKSNEITNGTFVKILHYKNFIASVFRNYNNPVNKLILYNYPAGNAYDSLEFSGNIVDMIPADNMEIFLIVNDDGVTRLLTYNFNQKSLFFRDEITQGEVNAVAGNQENIFLLDNSSVMWYRPGTGSNVRYLEMDNINTVAFDSLNNTLYLGKEDSLLQYAIPYTTPMFSVKLQEVVKDIEFIYNK